MEEHFLGFWNLENLFDVANSPSRPEYLQRQLKTELKGWTSSVLAAKLSQLTQIITKMNDGAGPDILGICEIESELVVQKLLDALPTNGRQYKIAHADTADNRGIDVAVIYDGEKYAAGQTFSHFVQKRTATRDIFQVNLKTTSGRDLVIVGNHWPSRSGGQYQTEPYRMMVGETLAYFHKRIVEEMGDDTAIVAMGDFNDEPFDRSIREYAQVSRERRKIMNAKKIDYFYNLMWEIAGERAATYYFGSQPNLLDQFWISKGILKNGSIFKVKKGSVDIFQPEELVASGTYPRPKKFGRPSRPKTFDRTGYSDHFPITFVLEERTAEV
ncbi:MAG: endonuclease [Hyphomicrobiaceae bacterium]